MDPLLSDPFYLLGLLKRIVSCILQREKSGEAFSAQSPSCTSSRVLPAPPPPLQLSPFFLSIEKRSNDLKLVVSVDEIMETIRPIFAPGQSVEGKNIAVYPSSRKGGGAGDEQRVAHRPTTRSVHLNPKDLHLLRHLLPLEESAKKKGKANSFCLSPGDTVGNHSSYLAAAGEEKEDEGLLTPGEVLFYLVQLLPQQSFLVHQILHQLRQAVWHLSCTLSVPPEAFFRSLLVGNWSSSSPSSAGFPSSAYPVVDREKFIFFLVGECGLSVCQALVLSHYCKLDEKAVLQENMKNGFPSQHATSPLSSMPDRDEVTVLDGDLVYSLCFAVEKRQLNDNVAYPLLARQFAEAVVDPYATSSFENSSGSLFLESVLQYLTATSEEGSQLRTNHPGALPRESSTTTRTGEIKTGVRDEGLNLPGSSFSLPLSVLCKRFLDEQQFEQLCWLSGTPNHIILPLFHYLAEKVPVSSSLCFTDSNSKEGSFSPGIGEQRSGKTEGSSKEREHCSFTHSHRLRVSVSRIISMFYQFFPSPSPSMWLLCRSAFAQCLCKSENPLVFVELFASLRSWGVNPIPISPYLQAMRQALSTAPVRNMVSNAARYVSGFTDMELEYFRCKGSGEYTGGGKDRVSLLRVWTTPVPASRQAIIEKVWDHLERQYAMMEETHRPSSEMYKKTGERGVAESSFSVEAKSHQPSASHRFFAVDGVTGRGTEEQKKSNEQRSLPVAFILDSFCTERIEGTRPQQNAKKMKEAMRSYFEELTESELEDCVGMSNQHPSGSEPLHGSTESRVPVPSCKGSSTDYPAQHSCGGVSSQSPTVSFTELQFFFTLLSAGMDDDPTFTMMLWRGFGVGNTVSRRGKNKNFL